MGGFRPKLSTMIKYLNLSRFEKRLFGDQTPPQTHGYPRQAYVRALLVKIILGFGYRDLVAFLSRYRGYKRVCGFGAGPLPHYTRFSAFLQKLDAEMLEEIVQVFIKRVLRQRKIPAKVLAVDSTLLRADCNSFTKKADPDVRTGRSSTKGWFHGYKLHLTVDAQEEMLLGWTVTPGNRYDGHEFLPLVRNAVRVTRQRPRAVIADKGNDAGYNYVGVVEEFGGVPVIDMRRQRRRPSGRQLTLDLFLGGNRPRNPKQQRSGRPLTKEQQMRQYPPIPRKSPQWRVYRTLRLSVERVISRLKDWFGLEQLWVRTLNRVRKVVALALLAWLVSALYLIRRNRPGLVRSFPYVL